MSVLGSVLGRAGSRQRTHGDMDGDIEGSVLGEILGELDGLDGDVLGAVHHAVSHAVSRRGGGAVVHHKKASWRHGELAPGVNAAQSGQVPLPLLSLQTGIFVAALQSQTYTGQLQKPYRAERLIATTVRTGPTATPRCLGQIFVGVDLNQAQIQPIDLEALGAPTAFDTRMQLMQAPPGVVITLLTSLFPGGILTAPDSIALAMFFLGEVIH